MTRLARFCQPYVEERLVTREQLEQILEEDITDVEWALYGEGKA